MKGFFSIIGRNFRIMSRSKFSTFLVLLAPILIVFLAGTAFSSDSLSNINAGIYSEKYSELTNSVVVNLEENLNVEKVSSEEKCINSIKEGVFHACIVFPKNLEIGDNESIKVYTDDSRVNIAHSIINEINSQISERASEEGILMAEMLLNKLQEVRDTLPREKEVLDKSKTDISSIKSEIVNIEGSLSSSMSSINSALSSLDDSLDYLEELNESTSSIESKINSAKDRLDSIDFDSIDEIKNIEEKSERIRLDLDSTSREISLLIEEISEVKIETAEEIVLPIQTEIKPISQDATNWNHLFPTLLALIVLLSSVFLASILVLGERKARARFRNFITPTSDFSFVAATYVTALLIVFAQLIILFAGANYLTSLEIDFSIWQISVILFFAVTAFIFLGMFVGYVFKSDETTVLASISAAALLIFFSNTILPVETIVGKFKYLAIYNPLFLTDDLLRKVVLFNFSIDLLYHELLIMAIAIFVLFIFAMVFMKLTKRSI